MKIRGIFSNQFYRFKNIWSIESPFIKKWVFLRHVGGDSILKNWLYTDKMVINKIGLFSRYVLKEGEYAVTFNPRSGLKA